MESPPREGVTEAAVVGESGGRSDEGTVDVRRVAEGVAGGHVPEPVVETRLA